MPRHTAKKKAVRRPSFQSGGEVGKPKKKRMTLKEAAAAARARSKKPSKSTTIEDLELKHEDEKTRKKRIKKDLRKGKRRKL